MADLVTLAPPALPSPRPCSPLVLPFPQRPPPHSLSNTSLTRNLHHLRYWSSSPLPSAIAVHSLGSATRRRAHSSSSSRARDSDLGHVRASKSAYFTRRMLPIRALLALSAAAAVVFLRKYGLDLSGAMFF